MESGNDKAVLDSIFNPLLPIGEHLDFFQEETSQESEDNTTEVRPEVKFFEAEGVKAAENGNLEAAVNFFTKAIEQDPKNPSCYNNRAQAYRLTGSIPEALNDLHNALLLSEGKGYTARQAFCQRGLIYRKEGKEDEARMDFETAAKLGSEFAKAQVIQMNPYAAMCNKMLHDMFTQLQKGETGGAAM